MFKLFLVLLFCFEPTWSFMDIVFDNKKTVHYLPSRNASNLEKVSYFEGELIYASCVLKKVKLGNSTFRFKKRDKLIYESKVTNYKLHYSIGILFDGENNVIMQIRMLPEYNNSVFECTDGINTLPVLILLDDSKPDYALNVNGIWFSKLPDYLREYIYYRNSNNEDITISVRTREEMKEDVEYQDDSITQGLADDDLNMEILSSTRYINTFRRLRAAKNHKNTRLPRIAIDFRTLCFDPYFVNLDPSKVLAKYVSNTARNTSVVKYELDFQEVAMIGCTSASGKGIISFAEGKGSLLIHDKTCAVVRVSTSGRFRCESSEDGRVTTTFLDVTIKHKNITTIKKHHGIKEKTTDKNVTLSNRRRNTLDKNTYGLSDILITIFVTMIITSVVTIVIYTVCLRRRRSNKPTVDETVQTPADSEPVYETIGTAYEHEEVDRPRREPYPLPPEECEENKKYVHYDTPYEWRIFRSPFRREQPRQNVRFNKTQN